MRSARKPQVHLTLLRAFCLSSMLCFFLGLPRAFPEEVDKEFKGFNERVIRHEKARRAVERGKIYLQDKLYDDARQEFTAALQLDADFIEARFCLGLAERGAGNYKLSIEHFKSLYKKKPGYKGLCLEFARSYLKLGDCTQAQSWLERHKERETEEVKDLRKLEREIKKCFARQEK